MPAPLSGTVLRITPQSSCVVANLVFAAKPQEPQDDTKRHLFTITLAIDVLVHGVIEWASRERDEPFGRSPNLGDQRADGTYSCKQCPRQVTPGKSNPGSTVCLAGGAG